MPRGFGLDEVAGGGGADFLIGGEQHGDGEFCCNSSAVELFDRFEGEVIAAFHVVYARAVAALAVAPPGQLAERADGVDGVHMAHNEDAGFTRFVREGGADAVTVAHAAGNALDAGAHDGEVAADHAHHAVDG